MGEYKPYTKGPAPTITLKATGELPERKCYDIYNGGPRSDTENEDILIRDMLEKWEHLGLWAEVAYHIFQSEPDSYWDHSGKGWSGNFGENGNYMDLIDHLQKKYGRTSGDDVCESTGLVRTTCLNAVEEAAGELAESLINRKLKGPDFIKQCNLEPFHDKKDKQTVFYTIAGHRDRYGKTCQFGYNVFGLAFYNFRLKVVSDGTPFATAIGDRTMEEAIQEVIDKKIIPGFTYKNTGSGETVLYPVENRSSGEASHSVELVREASESESNTITNSEEYNFSEMIGASVEVESLIPSSKLTVEMQFTAGQVISTAYGKETSVSSSTSQKAGETVIVPPHTAVAVRQAQSDTVTTLEYDCPIMLQFDVAVFSICGTCYDDDALVHKFNTAGYDQRSFITLFQASTNGKAGEDGSENLYIRCKNYSEVSGFDETYGITQVKSRCDGTTGRTLKWDTILSQPATNIHHVDMDTHSPADPWAPETLIRQICIHRPAALTGGCLTETAKSLTTVVEEFIPLYPLTKLQQTEGMAHYDVGVGDVLYPNTWTVGGYDADNVPFYRFDSSVGKWILVDEKGNVLKDDSVAGLYYEPLTKEPYIEGKKEGVVYAKYMIPDNYYKWMGETPITNESLVQTVFVKITIHDSKLEGHIETSGSVQVKNGSVTNLETLNTLNVKVYDETGTEIVVPVIWEVEKGHGDQITIRHNMMHVTVAGAYRIRARYESLLSDWVDVLAI